MTMLLLMKPSGEIRKNIGNKIGVAKKNSFYIFSCGEEKVGYKLRILWFVENGEGHLAMWGMYSYTA